MEANQSILHFFLQAGPVVKVVLAILIGLSITSWTIIFQRHFILKKARLSNNAFDEIFWSGKDITQLFSELKVKQRKEAMQGLNNIFTAGFNEFIRLRNRGIDNIELISSLVQRAMRIEQSREMDRLEHHLSFLATVGSTTPYIGLFGTVWGIMTSFQALGQVQQATIAMVAPGISEALIATAVGLFAAIPAVIAYNRFSNQVERMNNQFDTFTEEFTNILYHQQENLAQA